MPVSYPGEKSSINSNNASMSTDRYFVMKSLTEEDLEASRQDGIWVTQTHNEVKLNQAFEVSGLILSLVARLLFLTLTIAPNRSLLSKST